MSEVASHAGTVVVVTDSRDRLTQVALVLEPEGFAVSAECEPAPALATALRGQASLVVVDAAFRAGGAVTAIGAIRRHSTVPIVAVSARTDRAELPALMEAGADDYVTLSVGAAEIVARVRALLRRARAYAGHLGRCLRVGTLVIDPSGRSVRLDGLPVRCTGIEYDLLEHLAREAGNTVTRDQLSRVVCGREPSPMDRAIDVHVSRLRRKLRTTGIRILTVRAVGYMLAPASAVAGYGEADCASAPSESVQPGVDVSERRSIERIDAARAFDADVRKPGIAQHPEVPRNRGLREAELRRDDLDHFARDATC